MTADARSRRGRLNTVSLRLRVPSPAILVLAVDDVLLGVTVNAVFVAQSNRSLDALLTGRAQLARQLARAGVGPPDDREPGRGRRRTGPSGAAQRNGVRHRVPAGNAVKTSR